MTKNILSRLLLIVGLLISPGNSILAQESKTCGSFNTYNFYLYNFDVELFYDCVYAESGRLNLVQDENGSIPIFKALFSDIDSTYFDKINTIQSDFELIKEACDLVICNDSDADTLNKHFEKGIIKK